jgi:hypothetical protein
MAFNFEFFNKGRIYTITYLENRLNSERQAMDNRKKYAD